MNDSISDGKKQEDLTGRSRFARNVLFSWGSYIVYIVAGFVMPRLISQKLGQTALGVWDFAWTTVGYFGLIELGIGASVDRYVARYRSAGDTPGLIRSVSSIFVWMMGVGLVVFMGTCAVSLWVIPTFKARLGDFTSQAQWIVFYLGSSISVEIALGAFWGVIIGVHRWDIHNSISAVCQAVSTLGMAAALFFGGGLVSMAAIYATMIMVGHAIRVPLAFRVCPELRIDLRQARISVLLEQARFSIKNLAPRIAELLVNQTANLLLAFYLGPASLAIFSRPRVLIKHVRTLIGKYSSILVPSASSLHAQDNLEALREMFRRRIHQAGCVSVPAVLWLALLGGPLVELWMGKAYYLPWLVPVLSFGYLATLSQDPIWAIMAGINQHGRIGLIKLAGACAAAIGVGLALAVFKAKLVGMAVGLTLPMFVVDAIIVPQLACRALGLRVSEFYLQAMWKPFLFSLPSLLCLIVARFLFSENHLLLFIVGGGASGVALVCVYYSFVLPERFRRAARARISRLMFATGA
jgi:O-antigen/teichoic acid export membrane protein